ncbi:MAG: hypothetical protein HDR49_07310 [Bacteroides sp.]|nr:hypothetical protein [Bacteroides sp.]
MNFQRKIITNMLAKIANKATESYVINRIWHKLDDIRVRFVLQQYVKRKDGYALADLYLPQVSMIIEVNEGYHEEETQQAKDAIRNREVADATNADVYVIKASGSLEEIHKQVDEVVTEIRRRISALGEHFLPCDYSITRSTPEYYKSRGFFSVNSEDWLTTIDDIAAVFGTNPKHRGYLRVSSVAVPNKKDEIVWWPQPNHRIWHNELSKDGRYIYEYNKRSDEERAKHISQWINSDQKRITFMKEMAYGVLPTYTFVGVFHINPQLTKEKNMCVWERISDTYQLNV